MWRQKQYPLVKIISRDYFFITQIYVALNSTKINGQVNLINNKNSIKNIFFNIE